ncbi:MAG: DNA mismatch repair endonuclease MutL [Alphaproteobacteria bacterium]|nr:DNA mismatch repair endonuclease MutL [Alphaproteobacteria bacterium]MBN2675584.1 DNA mismatch repair endonuclease MutL [Alphaproteobacteria bacterium]
MSIRELPDFLIDQIAAGEVVERPASVVKELIENALDAGSSQIIIDVTDGGRTMISVIDNGSGMSRDDLLKSIKRHATSKLPDDNLLNISFMGFRGEALPSIASVSDMTIDTYNGIDSHGWFLDCNIMSIKPSSWESGTRIRVLNLFGKTPARLKFLRTDRSEMISVVDVVKRLAMARPDVGFTLNNRWRFPRGQTLSERIISIMGEEARDRMLTIDNVSNSSGVLSLRGFISEPTFRRASSVDQYLFVNNRPVKDKVLVGALRAAYMDVMHAREFPLCALYLDLDPKSVDVNVSPAKTEVHFLEPARVRGFIIRTLRDNISKTMVDFGNHEIERFQHSEPEQSSFLMSFKDNFLSVHNDRPTFFGVYDKSENIENKNDNMPYTRPLGRVIGQYSNKYIIAESEQGFVIVDQHAAHERIIYEKLRTHSIKVQPLLTPIVVNMKPEEVSAILEIKDDIKSCGLTLDQFGDDAIAIFEKPADWDLNWKKLLHDISDEVSENGHSSQLHEKLHLKLANYACHHSVRAGQRLDWVQMDKLLRDIENTERAGQCNHGRPVYKIIKISEIDTWFERI